MNYQHNFFRTRSPREFRSNQEWLTWLSETLPRPYSAPDAPVAFDLFAGCGGLALGFESQGFRTAGFEMNSPAVSTYNANLEGGCEEAVLDVGAPDGEADIIIGGPPCQPFSQIGYQRGNRDPRDGFPIFLDAVNRIRPKIAIIENVRGLLYRNKDYLRLAARELEKFGYTVDARLLNAADYGAPQRRERVFVVASKVGWRWPEKYVEIPVTAGVALGDRAFECSEDSKFLTPGMDRYVAEYERKSHCVNPRDLHLDRPSRTVTCRNLGGATADMLRIRLSDGRRRMLTVREGALLQGFPEWFEFQGGEYEQCEQIGNAVPPLLAFAVAAQARKMLNGQAGVFSSGWKIQEPRGSMTSKILSGGEAAEKIEQALNIIKSAGVPVRKMPPRRRERVALALLASAHLRPGDSWKMAQSFFDDSGVKPLTTREIIKHWNAHYGQSVADSSYDDVRRKDLAFLVEAGLVVKSAADAAADVNNSTRGYAVSGYALPLLRQYGSKEWEKELKKFRAKAGDLRDRLSKSREFNMVPVTLPDGREFSLSPGPHNKIQKAVVEEFLPRFSKGAGVLYIGDTEKKMLHMDESAIASLGLQGFARGTLPDILAYEPERNWLFLVEAVHSSNPIDDLRHLNLRRLMQSCTAGCVYVTAFNSIADFARFSKQIAWETEVWIADDPDHMIHFNGDRFLGPHETSAD